MLRSMLTDEESRGVYSRTNAAPRMRPLFGGLLPAFSCLSRAPGIARPPLQWARDAPDFTDACGDDLKEEAEASTTEIRCLVRQQQDGVGAILGATCLTQTVATQSSQPLRRLGR